MKNIITVLFFFIIIIITNYEESELYNYNWFANFYV